MTGNNIKHFDNDLAYNLSPKGIKVVPTLTPTPVCLLDRFTALKVSDIELGNLNKPMALFSSSVEKSRESNSHYVSVQSPHLSIDCDLKIFLFIISEFHHQKLDLEQTSYSFSIDNLEERFPTLFKNKNKELKTLALTNSIFRLRHISILSFSDPLATKSASSEAVFNKLELLNQNEIICQLNCKPALQLFDLTFRQISMSQLESICRNTLGRTVIKLYLSLESASFSQAADGSVGYVDFSLTKLSQDLYPLSAPSSIILRSKYLKKLKEAVDDLTAMQYFSETPFYIERVTREVVIRFKKATSRIVKDNHNPLLKTKFEMKSLSSDILNDQLNVDFLSLPIEELTLLIKQNVRFDTEVKRAGGWLKKLTLLPIAHIARNVNNVNEIEFSRISFIEYKAALQWCVQNERAFECRVEKTKTNLDGRQLAFYRKLKDHFYITADPVMKQFEEHYLAENIKLDEMIGAFNIMDKLVPEEQHNILLNLLNKQRSDVELLKECLTFDVFNEMAKMDF